MKKINWKIGTALIIFLLSGPKTGAETNTIPDEIQETAHKFLHTRANAPAGQIKLWQDAALGESVPYHDFIGNEIAYCYNIVNKKKTMGYIILSNKETEHPIQEFATSVPPHKRSLTTCKNAAHKYIITHKLTGILGRPVYIYFCPSIYFIKFPLSDKSGQTINSIFIEMRSAAVVDNLKNLREPDASGHNSKKINPYWSSINSKPSGKDNTSFSYIENVPVYRFFISSYATAAAMVSGYWGLKRQGELDKPFIGEMTNHITRTCGCCGKEVLEMARGIRKFSLIRGYKIKAKERCKESKRPQERITFKEYQNEINADRPAVISFMHKNKCAKGIYFAKRCDIQTSVAGAGYLSDRTGDYIIAHEGLFSKEKSVASPGLEDSWVKPGVAFYNWDSIASNMILTIVHKPEKLLR